MDFSPESASQSRPRAARLYHKKSRNGCLRCKARRVKCDEKRPACGSCARHMVSCVYDSQPATSKTSPKRKSNERTLSPSEGSPLAGLHDANILEIPESRSRRLLELRLLQNYLAKISQPFPETQGADARAVWSFVEVPQMALEHDNLLYAMFAISATHLLRTEPSNTELLAARQTYLGLALREQRKAVSQLSSKNADAVCFASTLILVDAFATLQGRIIDPYLPPMEWLHMGRGVGTVFSIAMRIGREQETPKIMTLLDSLPALDDKDKMFSEYNRRDFVDLLRQDIEMGGEVEDLYDIDTREAYEKTLSYIGSVQHAIADSEPIHAICRRLMAFSPFIPKKFVDFVEEQRPRALVVLAHYFALAARVQSVWWMGNTAEREIRAIMKVLPPEWQEHMHWPFVMAGLISM